MAEVPKTRFSKKLLLFTGFGLLTLVLYLYHLVGAENIINILTYANLLFYFSAFMTFMLGVLLCFVDVAQPAKQSECWTYR